MTDPTRYTCDDVFRRLDDFLDRELGEAEMRLVQEHLDTCAQCAREHHFELKVLEGVRGKVQRIQVPETLRMRVAKAIEEERKRMA